MAGQLKEVRNRIQSVQSTQQITKAMMRMTWDPLQVKGAEQIHWTMKISK